MIYGSQENVLQISKKYPLSSKVVRKQKWKVSLIKSGYILWNIKIWKQAREIFIILNVVLYIFKEEVS